MQNATLLCYLYNARLQFIKFFGNSQRDISLEKFTENNKFQSNA